MYKSKLLSYAEYKALAIYHACNIVIAPLDSFQNLFLSEIGVSDTDALFHFNLAPLRCRRDIARLGLIHRCVLGRDLTTLKRSSKYPQIRHATHATEARDTAGRSSITETDSFCNWSGEALWASFGYTINYRKRSLATTT